MLTASTGPFTKEGAVYSRPLDLDVDPFLPCTGYFPFNLDTFQLAASGSVAMFGTDDGRVFVTESLGRPWSQVADSLGPVRCLAFAFP